MVKSTWFPMLLAALWSWFSRPRGVSIAAMAFVILTGCITELDPTLGDDFIEPLDTGDNFDEQGVYNCSERAERGYRSGSPFDIKVVTVDGRPAERSTANAYIVMQEAARKDGVGIRIVSGFRSNAEQQRLYSCYVNCNCNNCNLAARPGYSNHQSGHALDLNTSSGGVLSWLNRRGSSFGFARTVPSEAWHWEWWGGGPGGGPCGNNLPRGCQTGDFDGVYCDDDRSSQEAAHDYLWRTLDVPWKCANKGGHRAFCPSAEVTRGESVMVLGKGFDVPTGKRNAFPDDNGHKYEKWMNSAAFYGVVKGIDGKAKPDAKVSRSTLAIILARTFALPPADRDYFDDDDGSSAESAHNKVAAAGLMVGYDDGAGRRDFKGSKIVKRSAMALVARRAADKHLVPIWDLPRPCQTGNYDGAFCDDDDSRAEASIDTLKNELGVNFSCGSLNGHPAFCPGKEVNRGQLFFVLTKAAGIPLAGDDDAFSDDDGSRYERYYNAAYAWGIVHGYDDGTVRAGNVAGRNTLAIVLARLYDLPPATRDYFSDDNGSTHEALHNKVAEAGLITGYDDGHGGKLFGADRKVTRSTLAIVAARAARAGLVPVWEKE